MRPTIYNLRPSARRGNAILETALVLGLLMSLSFGAVEFGHFFFVKNTLQGAAREGARAAIPAAATNAQVQAAVNNSLKAAGLELPKYTVKIRNADDTADVDVATQPAGAGILVRVTATWGAIGIRPMGMIDPKKAVNGVTVMRKEAT